MAMLIAEAGHVRAESGIFSDSATGGRIILKPLMKNSLIIMDVTTVKTKAHSASHVLKMAGRARPS